ncbi:enoyl-[acyl-carrier-protein] reductase FabK [Dethiobacter alkaliphilus]|uniref:enoyl-[acyl-carrier-protein] reductase FabK n=1 Tax=Dethiobacter alkaliphilus TaxID=427926 RepID=UPI0022262BFE|nr:enoyl-[acyl-carrier-protein] reductase FabK [Dethiobacter alkaliphilus]MCW3489930.1 enoyl-[acyl-carrier-protein] reductase FabK [Dethiobacter alkaliphilus]
MTLKTNLCNVLGIKVPVLQGGMAWVATGELAAAVSEAGGLGIIGAGNAPAEVLEQEIKKAKELTDKPFGVNIMLLSPFVDDVVDLICREEVRVVTTGAGNPGKYVDRFKEKDIKVIPVVSSVALAKRLERLGVDAMIAEGMEAGGHIGELTTMVLVPQIVDAVNVPVIAAGGIADGRGVTAALALGAEGVQLGTRFICAHECTVHEKYKEKVIKAKDRDAVVTGQSTGHPVRVLNNKLSREFSRMENQGATPEELEEFGAGKLAAAVRDGDVVNGSVMAGQSAAMVVKEESCQEIIDDLISHTIRVIDELKEKFGS